MAAATSDAPTQRAGDWGSRLAAVLPSGRTISADLWARRHRSILAILWAHVPLVVAFGVWRGFEPIHAVEEAAIVAGAAVLATVPIQRRLRAVGASFGLLSASAILVHMSGGYIEMHFHYFVVIPIIALYEDWTVFLLAIGYVLMQHGIMGSLDAASVYNHPGGQAMPWTFAAIHAFFIGCISLASVYSWRVTEKARAALRESEERYRFLVENATDIVALSEPDGRLVYASPALERVTGRKTESLLGLPGMELASPEDRAVADRERARVLEEGQAETTLRILRTDGQVRWVSARAKLVQSDGKPRLLTWAHDITEQKQAEDAVARLAAIVEGTDDAVVSKSPDGTIMTWNRGAERLYGYAAHEVVGRAITVLLPPGLEREEDAIMDRIRAGERIEPYETMRRRKDGTLLPVSLSVSPVKDAQGRVIAAAHVARDITRQKQTEDSLRAAKERLEELHRTKVDFLNQIAHDLRTPMTPILMHLELLKIKGLSPDHLRSVEVLDRSMERLNHMVRQLLDVARMESGKLPLDLAPVDLASVVQEAIDTFQESAKQSDVALAVRIQGPTLVLADGLRLSQVVVNLVSNALKFTKRGSVTVDVGREGDHAVVRVSDTGEGFAPEEQARLFQAFSQLDRGSRRGGSGLGLYISRAIVEQHGGTIEAASDGPGQGATFTFRIPCAPAKEMGPPAGGPGLLSAP